MDTKTLLSILHLSERLKNCTRHSWTSNGRQESVAEHCWRMTLMAWLLRDEFPQADPEKLMAMCLLHDLGEAFTGDIPAFVKTSDDEQREQELLSQWVDSLPEPQHQSLSALFLEMEQQTSLESRIMKALDKLEVVIQHNEAELSTWLPLEYELNLTHGEAQAQISPFLAELREQVRQETLDKIEQAQKKDRSLSL